MCGIVGFSWEDGKLIKKLMNVIQHRGPDDSGFFAKKVSLANLRLSIQDLSKKGHQPMKRKHLTIVFNGEIYNFKDIRKELKGYKFTSDSDTEVILYAYDKWGAKCLDKFNGMFAFCIYDDKKKKLFIARDRFGIKPLYYCEHSGKLAFASEIKSLIPLLKKKEIDEEGLQQFFNFRFTLGDKTLLKGVKRLLPGHHLTFDLKKKKSQVKQYYSLKKQEVKHKPFSYYKKHVKQLMEKAVERRMVSDVPVACLLSGGIDSSIITAVAKKHNKQLNTFSIGFETTNELPYAKMASNHIKTKHHEFKMSTSKLLDYLDKVVYHMDEPIGDPGFLPIYALAKEVKKHNKVVLSGDGGDEVFCGYDRYIMYHYGRKLSHFAFFDFGNDILRRLRKMRGKSDYEAFFEIIRLFDDQELEKLGMKKYDGSNIWKDNYKAKVTNAQEFDINTVIPNDFFMKTDKMSSAFGLEQRVPFFDHEVVEFAFSIPLKYKLKGLKEKYILKETFRNVLPEEIVERKKHGFDVPIDHWFKNKLGDKLRKLLKKNNHNLYNKEYIFELLDKIKSSGDNYKLNWYLAQKLWSILVFEMWYEKFIKF